MDKFKICPVCHTKNSPAVLECVECGNDLMGVRIVDETFLEEQKKTENRGRRGERGKEAPRPSDARGGGVRVWVWVSLRV